ncbi:class I SAM-dependent methyltransferase [Cohnella zeiphila]|uniref:class I SAM-dependent methyltransferase n=1 Tax=Cohnella zeiphila TaxID=2761120 RepID=UPI00307FD31C
MTTPEKPSARAEREAGRIAAELGCAFVPRRRDTIRGLARRRADAADGVLVVGEEEMRFAGIEGPPLFFHPSMALVRVKRMLTGDRDALIAASDVLPGDSVLDCTAGLGSDAIVLSYAAGSEGRVVALEASGLLHLIVREGLQRYRSEVPELNEAMRRIEMRRTDHLTYLREQPDRSFDIVFFDPMFSKPVLSSASLQPLRSVAEATPLVPEAVEQARRVARKAVVLKEHRDSGEFARLGFERCRGGGTSVAYGVIRLT